MLPDTGRVHASCPRARAGQLLGEGLPESEGPQGVVLATAPQSCDRDTDANCRLGEGRDDQVGDERREEGGGTGGATEISKEATLSKGKERLGSPERLGLPGSGSVS